MESDELNTWDSLNYSRNALLKGLFHPASLHVSSLGLPLLSPFSMDDRIILTSRIKNSKGALWAKHVAFL